MWNAIGKASKMPVSAMVNSWLKQPGFPQVDISQKNNTINSKAESIPNGTHKENSEGIMAHPNYIWIWEKKLKPNY